ncbi:MAG: NAD(P)/FAD-dependent oxidoreductase [Acetobacteraceae bacterium]|nr:NAD(P)/FAD-dependent oxidoreductase [Acetobacteraceae bacterium]
MSLYPDVAVIGAGPYGLSVAAHLRAAGIGFRIFGETMSFWQQRMPSGMLLKSDGYASNISDPECPFSLGAFCSQSGRPYADEGLPVSLETFVAYGRAFQKRRVPEVEDRRVVSLTRAPSGFLLSLDDGELVRARAVVVATGIGSFAHTPPALGTLAPDVLSHSSDHAALDRFRGQRVCVIGGGASAVDTSVLLHEAGAEVEMVAREIRMHDRVALRGRPITARVRTPHSGVGTGWRSAFFAHGAPVFHALPEKMRLRAVRNANGPAGGWAMRDRFHGRFAVQEGAVLEGSRMNEGRAELSIRTNGDIRRVSADHVIAATGFRNDLRQLAFLAPPLLGQIRAVENAPVLSRGMQSSVPGLYFVGAIAKNAFGPLMRFVFGAEFAAARTTRHIVRSAPRRLVAGRALVGAD